MPHDDGDRLWTLYSEANRFLNEGLIRQEVWPRDHLPQHVRWAQKGAAVRDFLSSQGVRRRVPIIHVAGTSGKGSLCYLLAQALHRGGYSTGLHITPYLQVATEKIWIDGAYVGGETFADLVQWVKAPAQAIRRPDFPTSAHGLASLTIALEAFRRARVDVAVLETGCGGRFDMTNQVENVVASVITSVGLDHVKTLGKGPGDVLSSIAWHKAGIMRTGVPSFSAVVGPPRALIEEEARRVGSPLTELSPQDGPFPERNLALARLVAAGLEPLFPGIREALEEVRHLRLPGRLEELPDRAPRCYLDGAHNRDKMGALVQCLPRKGVIILGMIGSREPEDLVPLLAPHGQAFVICPPSVVGKSPVPPDVLAQACAATGVPTEVATGPADALARARALAAPQDFILATGSLYLIGEIRGLFYPPEQVLLARSSWPESFP